MAADQEAVGNNIDCWSWFYREPASFDFNYSFTDFAIYKILSQATTCGPGQYQRGQILYGDSNRLLRVPATKRHPAVPWYWCRAPGYRWPWPPCEGCAWLPGANGGAGNDCSREYDSRKQHRFQLPVVQPWQ